MEDFGPIVNTGAAQIGSDEKALIERLTKLKKESEESKKKFLNGPEDMVDKDSLALYRGETVRKDQHFDGNFLQAFTDRMVAQLTDNRPILRVENRKAGLNKVAKTLEKVVHGVWQESDLQRQAFKMCHNAAIRRSSGLYTGYDPVEDMIYFEILQRSQVYSDPMVGEAGLMDRGEYVIIERIKPISEIRLRFPGRGAQVKPDASTRPLGGLGTTINSPVTELIKRDQSVKINEDGIPRAKVWEAIIRDRQLDTAGKRLFPTYRQIIYTRHLVLSDAPLTYWDGLIPIDWFDWAVDPEHPWGISAMALGKRMQLAFNDIMDTTVENTVISNFMTVTGPDDALSAKQWGLLGKIRSSIILKTTSANKVVSVQPPPVYGADKVTLAKTIFNFAQLLFGVTDVTLGENPGSLQSGVAVEGLQESANLMTRARASRLEDFFTRVGNKIIARIFQYVTSDRVFSFVGPTGEAFEYALRRQDLFVDAEGKPVSDKDRKDFFKYFRFSVLPGSSAPGTRSRRAEMMTNLQAIGCASRKMVLQAADFQDPDQMLADAEADFQKFPPPGFKRVEPPGGKK